MKKQGSEIHNLALQPKEYGLNPAAVQLLLQLLETTSQPLPASISFSDPEQSKQEEVILSIILDGFCYTLIRSRFEDDAEKMRFSPREIEIIRLVCRGMANKEIAALLEISRWTVSTYLRRVFIKMDVNSRTELVAKVLHTTSFSPSMMGPELLGMPGTRL